jgi:hypothetical protein
MGNVQNVNNIADPTFDYAFLRDLWVGKLSKAGIRLLSHGPLNGETLPHTTGST